MKRLTDERIAEPVAWLHANNAIGIPAITVSKKVADDWYQNGLSVQPLYAAPQPAPDEMTVETAYPEVQTGWNDAKNYVAGWNACRAVMLQSFGNSPVIPDGWVIVPKTATPDISLAINKVGQHCTCGNCSQRLWDMLLAAAPKPESAND